MKFLKWPAITFLSLLTLLFLKFEKKENPQRASRSPASTSLEKKPSSLPIRNISSAPFVNKELSLLEEISQLASCYEKECSPMSLDPRTQYYSLGQKLKEKLAQYNSYVTKNGLKNSEVNELALRFLTYSDGHVQEVALDLLSTQDPSEQNLEALLGNIINGFDAELIRHAFLELQRYTDLKDQEKIRSALGRGLLHGTPFVAVAIAGNMNLILSASNLSYFEKVMNSLDPRSRVYENLKFSIQEFAQVSQAG